MNPVLAHAIIGGIIFLLLKMRQTQTSIHKCKTPHTDSKTGLKGADCSQGGLSGGSIPDDLGDIAFLDISNNVLQQLNDKSFLKYASLRSLIMQSVTSKDGSVHIITNAFKPLTKLESLDMTKTSPTSFDIDWPTTLQNLTIANSNFESLDVNDLVNLVNFNASGNKLKEFPNFNPHTPLVSIDIRNNPIKNVTTAHIASFCYLKYFGVTYINSAEESTDDYLYCTCTNLLKWTDLYGIAPGSNAMTCNTFSKDKLPRCQEYILSSCKERRLCFLRTQLDRSIGSRVLIIGIFVIAVLLLIAIARAKPVYMPKVADTHPFEHHDAHEQTNSDLEIDEE